MVMILIANMGCYSSTHLTKISTPRFLGKKRRGKGLQRSSKMFLIPRRSSFLKRLIHIMERFTGFLQDLRSTAQRSVRRSLDIWILSEIEYLMVNSWNDCSLTCLEMMTWNTWRYQKEWESFKFGTQLIHEWQEYGRTKVARSGIAFHTMKGHTLERRDSRIHMIKNFGAIMWLTNSHNVLID
jgi:hypothetical protein